jgi:hypothetical protein
MVVLQARQAFVEKPFRHRYTTCGLVSKRAAISLLANPSAAINTIFARTTR